MKHLSDKTEHNDFIELEQWIRKSGVSGPSMSDRIMNRIGERELKRQQWRANCMKKTIVAATTVVVLGAGIAGTGFVSPVMASTLQHIPLVGSIFSGMTEEGLRTAVEQGVVTTPNVSVTHDGVTLQVTDLLFDGTRLSFAIERKADHMPTQVFSPYIPMNAQPINDDNEWVKSRQVSVEQQARGYVENPVVLIDGEQIQFDESSIGDDPFRANVLLAEYTKGLSLPDSFELTIRTSVTQVNEPFEFKIPVEIDKNLLVIKPEATQSNGQFRYTVARLEFTSATTRLILDSQGQVPATEEQSGDYAPTMMYYDLVDDEGNIIEQKRLSFFHSLPKSQYHVNELYGALERLPKFITIKPYTFTVKPADWSIVGESKGADGKVVYENKTYIQDLEMTIPVQP